MLISYSYIHHINEKLQSDIKTFVLLFVKPVSYFKYKAKAAPQHAMKALGGREDIAPAHS
jgi:hypothetical protein